MMNFSATSKSTYDAHGPKDAEETSIGLIFHWLYRRDPLRARTRFAKLYWFGYKRFIMSFFLFVFGVTFLIIGSTCMKVCTDFDRGVGFFFVGALMFIPGCYGSVMILNYVRCRPGYHYEMLPQMD